MSASFLRFAPLASLLLGSVAIFCSAIMIGYLRTRATQAGLLLAVVHSSHAAQCPQVNTADIDLSWHAPNKTSINSLATVINGTGVSGYIFNSSTTPAGESYSSYNWCNMPHVRAQEYTKAPAGYELKYVELVRLSTTPTWVFN